DVRLLVVHPSIRIVSCEDQIWIEIAFIRTTVIVIQTAFTHYAVTLEAGIVNRLDLFGNFRGIVFEETFYESNFAVQLCVENRIGAGQCDRGPTPLAEGGNVHYGS